MERHYYHDREFRERRHSNHFRKGRNSSFQFSDHMRNHGPIRYHDQERYDYYYSRQDTDRDHRGDRSFNGSHHRYRERRHLQRDHRNSRSRSKSRERSPFHFEEEPKVVREVRLPKEKENDIIKKVMGFDEFNLTKDNQEERDAKYRGGIFRDRLDNSEKSKQSSKKSEKELSLRRSDGASR